MHGTPDGQWGVPGYTEVRELGAGAAGRVVLARRNHDGADVAIKYLSDALRADVGFVARFRHEARLLGTIRSPYNARLIDYVEDGQGAAIVMELVDGVSLRALLSSEGPTGPEAALVVLKGALKGLAAAHAIGVVHRDFKPENVMVQGDGTSKLVDFGIAVRNGESGNAAGTPHYMAPEQWSGAAAAPSTDVYAATVVFFECLTGTRPFRAPNLAALAHQHQTAPPPIEEVPEPLQGLLERGMSKQPADRPPSAEAFLDELESVAAGAYGPDWEERGRRRLARLSGLLLMLFPRPDELAPEANSTLARTQLPEPSTLLTKLGVKVAIGLTTILVITGVTVVLMNSGDDDPTLLAGRATVSPTAPASLSVPDPPEVTEEPTEEPVETPEPTATVETTPPPTVQPPTQTAQPPTPTPTVKPTKRPRRTPTPKPVKTKPAPTPSPDVTLRDGGKDNEPRSTMTTSAPPPTTSAPTAAPTTTRPQPTRTEPTGEPTTEEPGTDNPTISMTTSPDPAETPRIELAHAPAALLVVGLVTSGAVPVTLAVKRRVAGRHRRKR
ncbi:protein kinase [Nonomuraea sp. NPDC046570]|uniref:serine/threonine-protein kinase n=1 Tax=Nonomuraea sp. NPDC046570 TaxID=3155255 RepID=UPI0033CA5B0A